MKNKFQILLCVMVVLAVCLSIAAIVVAVPALQNSKKEAETQTVAPQTDVQYVLYLGTNDKDTNMPVYTPEVAKTKLQEILCEEFGGYTIQEANGGWKDGEEYYQEYTLVIYLSDTTLEKVHQVSDRLIQEYNQSSILIHSNQTVTEFYAGAN